MCFKRVHIVFTCVLSCWMLLVSSGLIVDFHFCEDKLSNLAVFKEAQSCHELAAKRASKQKTCCQKTEKANKTCGQTEAKDGCCSHTMSVFQLDIDYPLESIGTFNFEQNDCSILSFPLVLSQRPSTHKLLTPYQNYKPPLLDKNLLIFIQSFLC